MARIKGSLVIRERNALKRLEAAYEKFKAAGEDKKPWSSTRNGRTIYHKGRSYNEECERMKKEISILKDKLSKVHL
jgi:iron-sulfur cluster repair protein YtfE (RIC family)